MGCDIHVYTEKQLEDGSWWCTDRWKMNEYYGKYEYEPKYSVDHIYSDRYYELFATLADVRNYNDTKPIDEPRGLPGNVTEAVLKEYDRYKEDWHSASWLLASELFKHKAKRPFYKTCGMISPTDAFYLDELGRLPEQWCEYTSDESYVYREWLVPYSVLDGLIDAVKKRMKEEFRIYDWETKAKQEEQLAKYADKFRIVFWFDS